MIKRGISDDKEGGFPMIGNVVIGTLSVAISKMIFYIF